MRVDGGGGLNRRKESSVFQSVCQRKATIELNILGVTLQSLFLISKPFSKFFLQNFFCLKWAVAGRAIFPRGFLSSLLCMERHLSAAQKLPVLPVSVRHLSAAQKVQPAAINSLGGSSLTGAKLVVKPTRQSIRTKNIRSGAVVGKYGDNSVYFDLEDLGNTTGKWDLYGLDAMMIHMLVNILVNIQELKGPEFAATFSVSEDQLRKFIDAHREAVILPTAPAAPPYKEERKPPNEEEEERKQQPPEEGERRGDAGRGEGRREDDRGDKGSIGNDMVMRFD